MWRGWLNKEGHKNSYLQHMNSMKTTSLKYQFGGFQVSSMRISKTVVRITRQADRTNLSSGWPNCDRNRASSYDTRLDWVRNFEIICDGNVMAVYIQQVDCRLCFITVSKHLYNRLPAWYMCRCGSAISSMGNTPAVMSQAQWSTDDADDDPAREFLNWSLTIDWPVPKAPMMVAIIIFDY